MYWDISTFNRGWKSLIAESSLESSRKSTHCSQTTETMHLELVAPVAPLKAVLLAFEGTDYDEWSSDHWDTLESWNGYDELGGVFEIDDDEDMPLCLSQTQMVLIAEKPETENFQAILIQPSADSNYFKRVGWFICQDSYEADEEEVDEEEMVNDRDFEPMLKVFRSQRKFLV